MPYADVVAFTTHKTLRGPRGGAIVCREEYAKKIDSAVFPGQQGGPLEHAIAAKAVAFKEAALPSFATYTEQVVANAKAFGDALAKEGFRNVSGGTREPHGARGPARVRRGADRQGRPKRCSTARASRRTATRSPTTRAARSSRRGFASAAPRETTAGMKEGEFETIATLMSRALRHRDDEAIVAEVRADVATLCASFNPYANFTK